MSSRPACRAALTLLVRSTLSFLYFWFSFSSSVTLAFTIAIDSFIFGTWSFRSRMFCSRIISGSSTEEIIQPNMERIARLKRCHMGATSLSREPRDRYQDFRWLARTRPLCKPPWFRMAARPPARRSRTGRATSAAPRRWSSRSARGGAARPLEPDRPAGRREAPLAAAVRSGVALGAARPVPGSVVEEAAQQAAHGRRRAGGADAALAARRGRGRFPNRRARLRRGGHRHLGGGRLRQCGRSGAAVGRRAGGALHARAEVRAHRAAGVPGAVREPGTAGRGAAPGFRRADRPRVDRRAPEVIALRAANGYCAPVRRAALLLCLFGCKAAAPPPPGAAGPVEAVQEFAAALQRGDAAAAYALLSTRTQREADQIAARARAAAGDAGGVPESGRQMLFGS